MFWIITKDTSTEARQVGGGRYPTVGGPEQVKSKPLDQRVTEIEQYLAMQPKRFCFEFRLLDDDGEVYYEGRCGNLDKASGDSAFEPLDWAEGHAGCTEMQYRRVGEQEWKTL